MSTTYLLGQLQPARVPGRRLFRPLGPQPQCRDGAGQVRLLGRVGRGRHEGQWQHVFVPNDQAGKHPPAPAPEDGGVAAANGVGGIEHDALALEERKKGVCVCVRVCEKESSEIK